MRATDPEYALAMKNAESQSPQPAARRDSQAEEIAIQTCLVM